jgi:hypothetical protein
MMDQMTHRYGANFSYDATEGVAIDETSHATLGYRYGPNEPGETQFQYKDERGEVHIYATWANSPGSSRADRVQISVQGANFALRQHFGRFPATEEARQFLDYLAKFIAFFLQEYDAAVGSGRHTYYVDMP